MSGPVGMPRRKPWWERIPSGRLRLYLALVVALAALGGAVEGAVHGGLNGAVNGAIYGAIVSPFVAWWAWSIRHNRQRFWVRLLFGSLIEVAGVLLIHVAARVLAFGPAWVLWGAMAGGWVLTTAMMMTYVAVIRREMTWALRGAAIGAVVAALAAVVGAIIFLRLAAGQGEWLATVILVAALGLCLPIGGAFVGAFLGALLRRCVRVVRSLRIRARCRRRRLAAAWPDAPGDEVWDLGDADRVIAAGPGRVEAAQLLLQALAEGTGILTLASLGQVCRLRQHRDGVTRELVPRPLPAVDFVQGLLTLGQPTLAGTPEAAAGKLHFQLGEQAVEVSVILRLRNEQPSGELRFPPRDGLAEAARRALAEYHELLGEGWDDSLAPIILGRPEEASPSTGPRAAAVRFFFRWPKGQGPPPPYPIYVVFDGVVIGQGSMQSGLRVVVRADVGKHLLRLNPGKPLRLMGRDYLVQVNEPGSYDVRLRWNSWGTFHRRAEVVALPAVGQTPPSGSDQPPANP
ncbi:MAG TPA: hypothetical protein VJ739_05660 [Gemmataceae bacterium]|nr:hypothetical protein [Gemmataceae bacterium]